MWVEAKATVKAEEGERVQCFRESHQGPSMLEVLTYLAKLIEVHLDGVFLDQLSVQAHVSLVSLEVTQWTSFAASRSNRGESIRRSLLMRRRALADHSCGNCSPLPPIPTDGFDTPPPSG